MILLKVERFIQLGAGDRLFLYSDGVPEAMNSDGKPFGDVALQHAIDEVGQLRGRKSLAGLIDVLNLLGRGRLVLQGRVRELEQPPQPRPIDRLPGFDTVRV